MEQSGSRGRRIGIAIAASIVSVLLVLGAVEAFTRAATLVSSKLSEATTLVTQSGFLRGAVQPDAELGYGLVPGYRGRGGKPSRPISLEFSSLGLRDREYDPTRADTGRRFVLGVGDSFSFGAGVELDQSFLARLESILRRGDPAATVVKAGVPGYSMVQSVGAARRHLDRFSPELVIVQLLPETEERNLLPQRAVSGMIVIPRKGWHYHGVGDSVLDSPFPPGAAATLDVWARRLSYAYRIVRRFAVSNFATGGSLTRSEMERSRRAGFDALAGLNHELRSRGAVLLVVLANWARQSAAGWEATAEPNGVYEAFCLEQGIEVLNTMPYFKAASERGGYLGLSPSNPHWSPAGHDLAARQIARAIARRGLLRRPDSLGVP